MGIQTPGRQRTIVVRRGGPVARAIRNHGGRDLLPDRDALVFAGVGTAFIDLAYASSITSFWPAYNAIRVCRAAAAAAASADASAAIGDRREVTRMAILNGVHRIGHRDMDHRQRARAGLPPTRAAFITSSAV